MAGRRQVAVFLLFGVGLFAGGARAASQDSGEPCTGVDPTLGAATEALDKGLFDEAARTLQPLGVSHPNCSGVVLGLARIRAARGDPAEAERLFTRATALAPDDPLGHALFARYSLSRGRPARADYLSSVALSLDPDCSEALVVAGQILGRKGRSHAAFAALEKAARVGPTNAEAQYQFGVFLFRRKLHAEAVRQFEKTVALRPLDARAHDYLALGFEAVGEAERAEQAYRSALEVNDGPFPDSFLDHNYGRFLLKQGRLEESQRHLDRAVALLPNSRAVHYERGKLNLALERYQAAREDAERALSLRDPGGLVLDLQVYYLLATIYTRLGESDLARKYAELARTTPIPNQD
jgi:tetratricopeptide (TPR) repeat protein